jgi:LuxR family maltose regulon positive regulatory protein
LQGPAGSGKSTLAAAWAAQDGRTWVWFRVDASDADLASTYAALASLMATVSRRRLPAAVLRAPPWADPAAQHLYARLFFRAFHTHCGPAVLVFDDVHAAPYPGFEALLLAAVDEAPASTTVLMTSRQPPQGVLLDAVARDDLGVVHGSALDFTVDEAMELLGPQMGPAQARQLLALTGGWAAGLTLLAANPAGTAEADAAERTVDDYFAQRVLGLLQHEQCKLLAAISWLPEVDEPALQALRLGADAPALLDQLCLKLGFVQRLRRGRACWRLHDLLKQALQSRWSQWGDAGWRQVTLEAVAGLHAEQGRLQAAVEALALSASPALALKTWCEQASLLLRQGRTQELVAAFACLDVGLAHKDADALTWRGMAAWLAQDPDTDVWFGRAWAALDATGAPTDTAARLLTAAAALNAQFSGWRSYVGHHDWRQRFLAAWPARAAVSGDESGLRVDKSAVLCFLTHRSAALAEDLREQLVGRVLLALARPDVALDPNVAVSASSSLVEWCNYTGDRVLLARLADLTPPWLSLPGLAATTQASWWISYGWVSVRLVMGRSDLPEGEAAVEHGVALAQASGAPDVAFYGLTNLVASAASRSLLDLAEQRLLQLQDVAAQRSGATEQPTQQATVHLLAARLLTLRGNASTALVRVTRALELARASDFPLSETWVYHLGHVQVLIALGREDEALAVVAQQSTAFDGLRRDYLQALGHLARLARAWRQSQPAQPSDVRACVDLAAQHAWMALGNHLPSQIAQLAAAALAQGVQRDFVLALIRARRLPAPQPDLVDWPWPLRIHALGGFAVSAAEQPLDFGARPQKKPLDLLRLLVARGPAPLDTASVLDALWPEAEGDRAKASLDMAILRLRKLLGQDEAVRLEDGHLALNRHWVWVDAWAWAAGQALPYNGPLFGQTPPELAWAAQREALHGQYLRRCRAQGQALEGDGQWASALALYESALTQDSLEEALHRGAIRCHMALGEPAAALRAFARCRDQLQAGLGVQPALATRALLASLLPSLLPPAP